MTAARSKIDLKVVLLGAHSTGKTCLVNRYLHNEFNDRQLATVGAAFGSKVIDVQGRPFVLGIWDTAGSERYESMARMYYRAADLTNADSFKKVEFWVREVKDNEPSCKIYIVGTKADLILEGKGRAVDRLQAEDLATRFNAVYCETSAKNGKGVADLFQRMGTDAQESRGQDVRETVTHAAAGTGSAAYPARPTMSEAVAIGTAPRPDGEGKKGCC